MNTQSTIRKLMKAEGFTLLRSARHLVWEGPTGERVTTSVSPSDYRAVDNIKRDIKRVKKVAA